MEVGQFFDTYVFGFMATDIEREIALAYDEENESGAGNFLCALGLMAYTEFMGIVLFRLKGKEKTGRKAFNRFFNYMGEGYAKFLSENNDVYSIFRNGMAHSYFVGEPCTIYMLNSKGPMTVKGFSPPRVAPSMLRPDVEIQRPIATGIGKASNGRYYFVVEKYFEDFRLACARLLQEFENSHRPTVQSLEFPPMGSSDGPMLE